MTIQRQPEATSSRPGAGPYGSASASSQFARMAPHEIAFQELQAHPPPLPVRFTPPLDDAEFEQATQQAMDRLHETVMQSWAAIYEQRMGHIPEAQFVQLWTSHEPLFVAGPDGGPQPNPWLAQLMTISAYQCHLDMQRLAKIQSRHAVG